jgi:hypothetical protein
VPHLAFLAGSSGDVADRSCTYDRLTAFLVPLINVECSTAEGNGTTAAELRICAQGIADDFTNLSLSIDGALVGGLKHFRVWSSPIPAGRGGWIWPR